MRERITPPWALILAGGDGTRLRPLTTQSTGELDPTRRAVDLRARFDHQIVVARPDRCEEGDLA